MLWGKSSSFSEHTFESEAELEKSIIECASVLFGQNRVYIDPKKKIGLKGKTQNVPDGYLLDLNSPKEPRLFVVENELAKHDHLKHIAVQILEFSLSFETSPHGVKSIVKDALSENPHAMQLCQQYAVANGFENVDVLLEKLVHGSNKFNALVIIDNLDEELEQVLVEKFKFPVEVLTIERFRSNSGENIYRFEPFLNDLAPDEEEETIKGAKPKVDLPDIDTIVVPARTEGFEDVFLGQNRWYAIRIHASMIPRIKYIAAYRVAPESAITHIAKVASIEPWNKTNKYVVNFDGLAEPVEPIQFNPNGTVRPPQAPRYTSRKRLATAKNLDDAF